MNTTIRTQRRYDHRLRDLVGKTQNVDVAIQMADGGVENFNPSVDQLVNDGLLKRVLAQTDVQFSNSMIEAWWRGLKH